VARDLRAFDPYVQTGWEIEPDKGFENNFAAGEPYEYSRAKIGSEFYDFGAPANRMVPVSSAVRMRRNPHVIIFGTRDQVKFDANALKNATNAKPADEIPEDEIFTVRPRSAETRYVFDPGPGEEFAKLMKDNLDLKKIFKRKNDREGNQLSYKKDGMHCRGRWFNSLLEN